MTDPQLHAPHGVPSEDARFPLDHPGWGRLIEAMDDPGNPREGR